MFNSPDEGTFASVNVVGVPAEGFTADEIAEAERALQGSGVLIQEEGDLIVAGHEANITHSTEEIEEGVDLLAAVSQVVVVIDDTVWVLTLATLARDLDKFLPIFEHMYNSFRP